VKQLEGLFDVPPSKRSEETWTVNLPIDEKPWNVGLIVGPSGSGKTTIAKELFGKHLVGKFKWSKDKSIVDCFPEEMSIKEITLLLSSVGFSSPPLWLRPFHVLSNGEQFRVTMARALAENKELTVIDEFTSVVDRTVAQIGSAAISKTVKRRGQKFIALSCHYDIAQWLEPDWVYEPHTDRFARDCLQRPKINLTICRVHYSAWGIFKKYHYLSSAYNKAARMFVAFLDDKPVAMQSVICSPHPKVKNLWRGHRAVCLPDYQGVGIGNALITFVGSAYRGIGARILSTTSNPALYSHRIKCRDWKLLHKPRIGSPMGKTSTARFTNVVDRLMMTWEYVGPAMEKKDAEKFIYG